MAGGAVCLGALTWGLWSSREQEPAARAREYLGFTACLLTDARGVADQRAAPVWAGMQDASLATHAKVQYLPVTAASGEADARPYLAGLLQRQCGVVIGVGAVQVAAVRMEAAEHPKVRFAVVEDPRDVALASPAPAGSAAGKVTTISESSPAKVRDRVAKFVRDAAKDHK